MAAGLQTFGHELYVLYVQYIRTGGEDMDSAINMPRSLARTNGARIHGCVWEFGKQHSVMPQPLVDPPARRPPQSPSRLTCDADRTCSPHFQPSSPSTEATRAASKPQLAYNMAKYGSVRVDRRGNTTSRIPQHHADRTIGRIPRFLLPVWSRFSPITGPAPRPFWLSRSLNMLLFSPS